MRFKIDADFEFDAENTKDAVQRLAAHLVAAVDPGIPDPFDGGEPQEGAIVISEVVKGKLSEVLNNHDYNIREGEALVVVQAHGVFAITNPEETELTEHGIAAIATAGLLSDPDEREDLVRGMRAKLAHRSRREGLH